MLRILYRNTISNFVRTYSINAPNSSMNNTNTKPDIKFATNFNNFEGSSTMNTNNSNRVNNQYELSKNEIESMKKFVNQKIEEEDRRKMANDYIAQSNKEADKFIILILGLAGLSFFWCGDSSE